MRTAIRTPDSRSRYPKLNTMVLLVHRSPVSSTFGYYVGGQKGATVAMSVDMIF